MLHDPELTRFIAALFSMMNPIGNLGVFVGMTDDRRAAESRRIAWVCAGSAAVTLLIVAWGGDFLLRFFGITVDSLRAAGGVIVLMIGLNMLFNNPAHKHSPGELADAKSRPNIGVVPLAIPIVAGPGTMAAVLVGAQAHPTILGKGEISIAIIALSALVGLLFSFATPIAKWLGKSGMGVVTRVMGMVLCAIAMGMLADGLKAMMPGLAG